MLGVGNVDEGLAVAFQAVAGRAVRMVERLGQEPHPGVGRQRIAGVEIVEFELRGEDVERDREQRGRHHFAENRGNLVIRPQMSGPDADAVARVVARREERQAMTMVEMGMRKKQIEIMCFAALLQRVAEQAQP